MKKYLITFIIISIILIIIKFFYSDYKIEYKIDGYEVKTTYSNNRYYFELNGKYKFNFDIYQERTLNKIKIKQIKTLPGETFECIYPVIDEIKTYPLCVENGINIDYNLINDEELLPYKEETKVIESTNANFEFYNNLSETTYIALWNYKGYLIMNNKSFENIEIFEKDRYDNSLSHQIENKIYMPNYDQEHEYNELIELDIVTKTKTTIKLNFKLDYDSYIVGNIDELLYIFDNKHEVLYEINLKKSKTTIKANNEKGFIKYNGEKFISCSKIEYKINKITYTEKVNKSKYNYTVEKGVTKTIKENKEITTKILNDDVTINNEYKNTLYYIHNNFLYRYTPEKGQEKIFYFFELNFNKDKTIYIYNK